MNDPPEGSICDGREAGKAIASASGEQLVLQCSPFRLHTQG